MDEMEFNYLHKKEALDRERHIKIFDKKAPSIAESNFSLESEVSIWMKLINILCSHICSIAQSWNVTQQRPIIILKYSITLVKWICMIRNKVQRDNSYLKILTKTASY